MPGLSCNGRNCVHAVLDASRSAQLPRLAAGFTEAVRGNGGGLVHTLAKCVLTRLTQEKSNRPGRLLWMV